MSVLFSVSSHLKDRMSSMPLLAAVVTTALLSAGSVAHAATVVTEPGAPENAIGITDLEFGGLVWNVSFINQSAENVYGGPPPVFDFDSATAEDVRTAVNLALTDQGGIQFTASRPAYDIGFSFKVLDVPIVGDVQVVGTYEAARGDGADDTWVSSPDPDVEAYLDPNVTYAKFSVVPIPAAVWLFGSGLLGLVGVARRKKTA